MPGPGTATHQSPWFDQNKQGGKMAKKKVKKDKKKSGMHKMPGGMMMSNAEMKGMMKKKGMPDKKRMKEMGIY